MTGRWNRTEIQILETQVKELTNLLEQARTRTDRAAMIDMLNRSGVKYDFQQNDTSHEGAPTEYIVIRQSPGAMFIFDVKTGRLIDIR